ncbi:hypothetical protein CPB85DRAFT_1255427 [Mucidula mucida]|nr:hypothetical protein CPB85DRAFT_1255427 [Mucidula mucida]
MPPDPGLNFLGSPYPYRSSGARDPVLELQQAEGEKFVQNRRRKGYTRQRQGQQDVGCSIRASRHKKVDSVMTTNTNEYCLRGSIQVNMMGGTEGIEQVDPHVTAKERRVISSQNMSIPGFRLLDSRLHNWDELTAADLNFANQH